MNDYKIKNILESLKEEVENGKVSLREAAVELHKAGWTNFIDIDATRNLLKTRNVTGDGNVPGFDSVRRQPPGFRRVSVWGDTRPGHEKKTAVP